MSRIRSIHPGLWTDEAFMALSAHARLLAIGIWTEAFDDGVFEWKPLTLKARIFPVDTVDVPALLEELVAAQCIRREENDGRQIGLIRNFREFQRPKTPNSSGLMRDEWRNYVGLAASTSVTLENHFGNGSEKAPQMEDGGWKVEEEKSPPPVYVAESAGARASFDEVFKVFPQNPTGSETKALAAWDATKAKDRPAILAAASRYRQWFIEDCETRKRTYDEGLKFVPHLPTWLAGDWRNAAALPLRNAEPDPDLAVIAVDTADFAAIVRLRGKAPVVGQSGRVTVTKSELEKARAAA